MGDRAAGRVYIVLGHTKNERSRRAAKALKSVSGCHGIGGRPRPEEMIVRNDGRNDTPVAVAAVGRGQNAGSFARIVLEAATVLRTGAGEATARPHEVARLNALAAFLDSVAETAARGGRRGRDSG